MTHARIYLVVALSFILAAAALVKGNDLALYASIAILVLCIVKDEAESMSPLTFSIVAVLAAVGSWVAGAVSILALVLA